MWTIFKILNFYTILASAYIWITGFIPIVVLLLILNIAMIICLGFIPLQFRFDWRTGLIILTLLALILWSTYTHSVNMAIYAIGMYLPVLYLIALPREYQSDLLKFITKWLSIILIPSLIIYWITLFVKLPSFGTFVAEDYEPFRNYIFYLKSTYDSGKFARFNAFLYEPGHLAMVCVFTMMANRFDFKNNKWLWVILTAVAFSFSLAGYLLTLIGFTLMKIDSVAKGITLLVAVAGVIFAVQNYFGEDNAVNQLILERLKYDQSKGISGNNRFFDNTDYEYYKATKNGDYWQGVNGKSNMDLIHGAGYKIYILRYGLIGVFLVLAFYLSLIPPKPDWRYTLSFLFLIALCFVQNAYPGWYAWVCPYVLGLNLSSKNDNSDDNNQNILTSFR